MLATILSPILLGLGVAVLGSIPPPADASTTPPPVYHSRNATVVTINDDHYGVRNISYFVTDGLAIIDGDVIYGPVEDLLHRSQGPFSRSLSVFAGASTWPGATLTYKFDSDATERILKTIVDTAIGRWKAGAPYLTFTKVANSAVGQNGVVMIKAPVCGGCNANIGYANSPRGMNLQQSCPSSPGTCGADEATHEFGHLLGLYHEHQRPDRESFVHYNCANLDPTCPAGTVMPAGKTCCDSGLPAGCCGNAGNFNIISGPTVDASGSYDVTSIMEYRRDAFAKPGTFTLTPARAGITVPASNIGTPDGADFQRICKLYRSDCPKALACFAGGCPSSCRPVPHCAKPSLCALIHPRPPCCSPVSCIAIFNRCSALGCDFLK